MTAEEWRELGEAIVVWSGWGVSSFPMFDRERFVRHFGERAAARLHALVRGYVNEFYDCEWSQRWDLDLCERADAAEREFAAKHPEMPAAAVRALGWHFSYTHFK